MAKILSKQRYSERVYRFEVEAPLIARARRAGHFVIVRVDEHGERIPLTIAGADLQRGSITLVVQAVGLSSQKLCRLQPGDELCDVVGPLGRATRIERFGTVVCAGGGVGVAPMLPIVEALHQAGNRVVTLLAGRSREFIILEEEMRRVSDEVIIMTDDGSYGQRGLVTEGIRQVCEREHVDKCYAIGPAVMMKFVCRLTKELGVPTEVSLNTIMVDGTGMCGACRVSVGGKTKFVCVDGPEFDGHQVDFDEMLNRLGAFRGEEHEALEHETQVAGAEVDSSVESVDTCRALDSLSEENPSLTASPASFSAEGGRDAAWRKQVRTAMKPRERMALPRVEMPHLDPAERARKLRQEVNLGLTEQMAIAEARRCLDCANPGCVEGCPVGIDIPRFVKQIELGAFSQAFDTIKETSALPAVCGRVCPQEKQCESRCIHHKMNSQPVAVGYLERFVSDRALLAAQAESTERRGGARPAASVDGATERRAVKVCAVGSGPASLSFAGSMARKGYQVTVLEALHEIGGVLKYGIPQFRLPNSVVDAEIESLEHQGVRFVRDCVVGKTISVDELRREGYAGIFVASGAGLPRFMGIEGENAVGVMSSNEYLTRVNLMDASNPDYDTPVSRGRKVLVVGGGNTAMDSVRTALRLGAESATIVYRRSMEEMPARVEEVRHAQEEGVNFMTLHNPLRYLTDEQGHVRGAELQVMRLGEPDASGRRSPVPVEGETRQVEADLVIVAIGVSPNPIVPSSVQGLEVSRRGTIVVDETMRSNQPDLYAGGDIVRGGATVILAMGDGRRAAESMAAQLEDA